MTVAIWVWLGWRNIVFKRDPGRPFLGFIRPETVSDGERRYRQRVPSRIIPRVY